MLAIYKKELKSFFTSILGYLFIGIFIAITGVFFMYYCLYNGLTDFSAYVLPNTMMILIVLIPIITMRLIADERNKKTDQLLLTSPVHVTDIVVGKFLAVLTIFVCILAVMMIMPIIVSFFGTVDWKAVFTGFLGYFLMGAAMLAIGLFISSLFTNQIAAVAVSFVVFIGMYFITTITSMIPGRARYAIIVSAIVVMAIMGIFYYFTKNWVPSAVVGVAGAGVIVLTYVLKPAIFDNGIVKAAEWLSIMKRFNNFSYGILDISSIVYFVSFIGVFLFLTVQTIEKRRWN